MAIKGLEIDDDVVQEKERQPSGSDGSWLLDSGVYPMQIDVAFLEESKGGALALNVYLRSTEFGRTVREKFWVASGNAKGNKNFYIDSEGKKRLLPGMMQANELSQLVTGKNIGQLDEEDRVINMWSYEAREEVPTKIRAIPDLIGETLTVGVVKVVDNKRAQNGAGEWVPTNDKKETNEVSKFFTEDGFTLAEKNAGATETSYLDAWKQKHEGVDVNRYKPQKDAPTPTNLNVDSDEDPLFS